MLLYASMSAFFSARARPEIAFQGAAMRASRRAGPQLDRLLAVDGRGALAGLVDRSQVVAVVEGGDAPAAVATQGTHHPARVDDGVGGFQVLATVADVVASRSSSRISV